MRRRGRRWALASLLIAASCAAAGPETRLVTGDGRYRLQADGSSLRLDDAAGKALKQWALRDRAGQPVQVQALAHHAGRQTFVVALSGARELWLISHDPAAPPFFNGWVHDYRMGEGLAEPGYLGLQRVLLRQPFSALWVDARLPWLLGQGGTAEAAEAVVLHLDIRREIAWLPLQGALSAARLLPADPAGNWQLALPADTGWRLVDTRRWQGRWVDRLPSP